MRYGNSGGSPWLSCCWAIHLLLLGGYQKKKKNRRNLKMLNFVGPQLPSRLHLVLPFSFILPFLLLLLLLHSIRFQGGGNCCATVFFFYYTHQKPSSSSSSSLTCWEKNKRRSRICLADSSFLFFFLRQPTTTTTQQHFFWFSPRPPALKCCFSRSSFIFKKYIKSQKFCFFSFIFLIIFLSGRCVPFLAWLMGPIASFISMFHSVVLHDEPLSCWLLVARSHLLLFSF